MSICQKCKYCAKRIAIYACCNCKSSSNTMCKKCMYICGSNKCYNIVCEECCIRDKCELCDIIFCKNHDFDDYDPDGNDEYNGGLRECYGACCGRIVCLDCVNRCNGDDNYYCNRCIEYGDIMCEHCLKPYCCEYCEHKCKCTEKLKG